AQSTSRLAPGDSRSGSRPPGVGSRAKKPSLDDMGPGTDRPVPRRDAALDVDPRTRAGAFGEGVRGPHKPTLDEMGPHAMLPVPKGKTPPAKPTKPARVIDIPDDQERKSRRGRRARKTGRPGQ
ncbi:MAG: excinuclease ABC subunit UvrB, partial [Pseudomonadota bacterium]